MRTVSECRKKKKRKKENRLTDCPIVMLKISQWALGSFKASDWCAKPHLHTSNPGKGHKIGGKKDPQFLIFPIEALQVKVFTGGSSAAHTHMYETHKHTHSTLLPLFVLWNSLSQFSDSQRILLHTLFSRLLSVTSEGHSCVCRSIL